MKLTNGTLFDVRKSLVHVIMNEASFVVDKYKLARRLELTEWKIIGARCPLEAPPNEIDPKGNPLMLKCEGWRPVPSENYDATWADWQYHLSVISPSENVIGWTTIYDNKRCALMEELGEVPPIAKVARICRRNNLGIMPDPVINDFSWELWLEAWEKGGEPQKERRCKKCGAPMRLKKGKYGTFYGCSNYGTTGCKYTEQAVST